jgi:AraC-like DNA-binding protein
MLELWEQNKISSKMKHLIILYLILFGGVLQCLWGEEVQIIHYDHRHGNINEHVYQIQQDSIGLLWISTYGGLYSFDGTEFFCHTDTVIAPVPGYKWKPSSPVEYRLMKQIEKEDSTIPFKQVRCGLTDRDGNLWIGNDHGLWMIRFVSSPFHLMNWDEEVICIFKQKNGKLWMSTRDRVVCLVDESLHPYAYLSPSGEWKKEKTCCGYFIMNIVEDSEQTLWLSARNDGLLHLVPKSGDSKNGYEITIYKEGENTPLKNIYSTHYDADRRLLWIASLKNGLHLLDCNTQYPGSINSSIAHPQNRLPDRLRGFTQIDSCYLLAHSDNGLFLMNTADWKHGIQSVAYTHDANNPSSIADNSVLCLYHDRKHALIYAGTSGGGLSVISRPHLLRGANQFQSFNKEKNFLPSNVVYALIADAHQRIWGFCDNDLFCLTSDHHNVTTFQSQSEAPWPGFSIGNALKLNDGRVVKGTLSGILYFNPDSLVTKRDIYDIYTKLIVTENSGEVRTLILPDTIRFNQRPKSIMVYASVLDFQRLSPITYAYRIAQTGGPWKYTSDMSRIELPKLPCGYSTLELEATNGDGVWSGNRRTIVFYTPYHWNRIIFISILLLLLSVGIYLSLRRYRGMRMKLSKEMKRNHVFKDIPTKEENDDKFKQEIREVIIRHLNHADFSVDALAQEMSLSRSVLSNHIKSCFEMTPVELINTIRMQAAMELIIHSDLNISEIAYRTGFNDPKYFSRMFKRVYGKSPSQFRNEENQA